MNQCPIIPSNSFQYNFKVPDQAVFYERTVVLECVNSHRVYLRVHTGTTVTTKISIAMACEVHLLCAIPTIHKQVSMILTMVCPKSSFRSITA